MEGLGSIPVFTLAGTRRNKLGKKHKRHREISMNCGEKDLGSGSVGQKFWRAVINQVAVRGRGSFPVRGSLLWLSLGMLLFCGIPALAQTQQATPAGAAEPAQNVGQVVGANGSQTVSPSKATEAGAAAAARQQPADQQAAGSVSGTVVDRTGGVVAGARVRLSTDDRSQNQEAISDSEGQFSLAGIAPGPFQLIIMADGFSTQTFSGALHSGEGFIAPPIELVVAGGATEVQVTMSRMEMAEAEIKDEEKQRVFGVVPNFYVTYDPTAFPLSRKQKFELAWKATIDPTSFGLTGAVAGIEQASNSFNGYGQGGQGYAKRYGASYADLVTSTFIGSAVLPSLLKQDPRYFYKGKGTVRSRILYAIANSVICKGDNGNWQPNYSSILGGLASGGISNFYYPDANRSDVTLTFENTLIGIGTTAAANILQEFVIRRLTPHAPSYTPAEP